MTIKTILVCVSSAESGGAALEAARQLATPFDAHVEALHVRADPRGLVPYSGEGMDGSMIEEIMEVTEREGGERAVRTRQMFDEFCRTSGLTIAETPAAAAGPTIAWREETGREDEVIALRGRLFDIVVVGRPVRDAALPSPITLEAALLDTGRPILIVPPGELASMGRGKQPGGDALPHRVHSPAVARRHGDPAFARTGGTAGHSAGGRGGAPGVERHHRRYQDVLRLRPRDRRRFSRSGGPGRCRHAGQGRLFAQPAAPDDPGRPDQTYHHPYGDSGAFGPLTGAIAVCRRVEGNLKLKPMRPFRAIRVRDRPESPVG